MKIHGTVDVFDTSGKAAQPSAFGDAEFLAADDREDEIVYDMMKANDDGYRISSTELRKKLDTPPKNPPDTNPAGFAVYLPTSTTKQAPPGAEAAKAARYPVQTQLP